MDNSCHINECKELVQEVLIYERLSYPSQLALEQCLRTLDKITTILLPTSGIK
jgi:hypothetical protein